MRGKYVDTGVYCGITYVETRKRRSEFMRRHLMEIIMDCIKTPVREEKCDGCKNKFRIHSVKSLMVCNNDRTEWDK